MYLNVVKAVQVKLFAVLTQEREHLDFSDSVYLYQSSPNDYWYIGQYNIQTLARQVLSHSFRLNQCFPYFSVQVNYLEI